MRFIEIEFVLSENAKRIHKKLIRQDNILSIGFAEKKHPILYYLTHRGTTSKEFNEVEMLRLTQDSYEKLRKILTEVE